MTTSNHPIPPMTHPISSGWDQPSRKDIVIIKDTAYMKQASFDKLSSRDWGFPTGVYEGKMWRCKMRLVWFIISTKDESKCMTQAMDIKIVQTLPSVCINCGGAGPHYVPPCMGDPGFFHCKPKDICKTCHGQSRIESSTSGRANGAPETVPCPTCIRDTKEVYDVRLSKKDTTEVTMLDGKKADIDRKEMEQAIDPHGKVFGEPKGRSLKEMMQEGKDHVDSNHSFLRNLSFPPPPAVKYQRNTLHFTPDMFVDIHSREELIKEIAKSPMLDKEEKPDGWVFDESKLEVHPFFDEEESPIGTWQTHVVQYESDILGYLSGPLPATPTVKALPEGYLEIPHTEQCLYEPPVCEYYMRFRDGTLSELHEAPAGGAGMGLWGTSPGNEDLHLTYLIPQGTQLIPVPIKTHPTAKTKEPLFKSAGAWPTPPAGKLPPHAVIVPKAAYDHLDAPQPEHREIPPEEAAIIRIIEMAYQRFRLAEASEYQRFPTNVYWTPAEYAAKMISDHYGSQFMVLAKQMAKAYNNGRCVRCGKKQACKKETP